MSALLLFLLAGCGELDFSLPPPPPTSRDLCIDMCGDLGVAEYASPGNLTGAHCRCRECAPREVEP